MAYEAVVTAVKPVCVSDLCEASKALQACDLC